MRAPGARQSTWAHVHYTREGPGARPGRARLDVPLPVHRRLPADRAGRAVAGVSRGRRGPPRTADWPEQKVELLFYAGGINTPAEFLEFIAAPRLEVSVASDSATGRPLAIAWLTHASDASAFVHYCVLGPPRRDVGKALLRHWCGLRDPDGAPRFDVLLGVTPDFHAAALRVLRIIQGPSRCGGGARCRDESG